MQVVQVIVNSLGSGDWVKVQTTDGESLHDNSRISAFDLVMILQNLGIHAELTEVTDKEMEEM